MVEWQDEPRVYYMYWVCQPKTRWAGITGTSQWVTKYVGISHNPWDRMQGHSRKSWWQNRTKPTGALIAVSPPLAGGKRITYREAKRIEEKEVLSWLPDYNREYMPTTAQLVAPFPLGKVKHGWRRNVRNSIIAAALLSHGLTVTVMILYMT